MRGTRRQQRGVSSRVHVEQVGQGSRRFCKAVWVAGGMSAFKAAAATQAHISSSSHTPKPLPTVQVLETENLCTLYCVVSKFSAKEWEASYEMLCDFVVGGMCG